MVFCIHNEQSFTLNSRTTHNSQPACKDCADNFEIMIIGLEDKFFVEVLK